MRTRIKICCISSLLEAKMAISGGADALGLVGKMPSGPGVISDKEIASIAGSIHPPIASFLLTSEQKAENIISHVRVTGVNTVQIVDELDERNYKFIRNSLPFLRIVQVLHVTGPETVTTALELADQVDAFLLDSGNPFAAVKILGGTGNIHNWNISREIVERASVPVFLAGGLNASNVAEAIQTVQPFGVDICSGVRTNGKLDTEKLAAFIKAVQQADSIVRSAG